VHDLRRPRARRVEDEPGLDVALLAGQLVAQPRAGHSAVGDVKVDHLVVGEDPPAVLPGSARKRPDGLPDLDRAVLDADCPLDRGVQPRLRLQGFRDRDLLGRHRPLARAREEAVGVLDVIGGRRDEQPAGVLDAVRDDPAQDRVLGHALVSGDRILDHVAPARVQQAVEAPARALGEVGAVGQDHAEAAQGGVPGDTGAGRTTADHQDIGLQLGHERSLSDGGRRPEAAAPLMT
jgi:hypothetical protein